MDKFINDPAQLKSSQKAETPRSRKEILAEKGLMQHNQVIPIWLKETLVKIAEGCKGGTPLGEVHFEEFLRTTFPGLPTERKKLVWDFIHRCHSTDSVEKEMYTMFWEVASENTRRRFQFRAELEKKRHLTSLGEKANNLKGWKRWVIKMILKS